MATLEEQQQQLQALIDRYSNQPDITLPTRPTGSTDDGTRPGWMGLLGEVLSGGQSPGYRLRGREEDTAGSKALLNFGINMMLASGPARVRPDLFSAAAAGLQGAQQSMDLSQQQGAAASKADYEARLEQAKLGIENQRTGLERIKGIAEIAKLQEALRTLGLRESVLGGGTSTAGGDYASGVAGIEGTGKDPRSSAVSGFIDSTWADFVKANPTLFAGMTPEQISAARMNKDMVARATDWYARTNAPTLQAAGITPSGQTLGIAHRVGPGAAIQLLKAPDSDVVGAHLSPEAVAANPDLAKMTVGQLKAQYARISNPGFLSEKTTTAAPSGATPPPARTQLASRTTGTATDATPAPAASSGAPPGALPVPPVPPAQPPPAPVAATSVPPVMAPPPPPPPSAAEAPPLPPGMNGVTANQYIEANLGRPTPEEEATFNTPLSPERRKAMDSQLEILKDAVRVARRGFAAGTDKDTGTIQKAEEALAKALAENEKEATEAAKVGDTRKVEWFQKRRDQLGAIYQKMLEGAETRLTAKESVVNHANQGAMDDTRKELQAANKVVTQIEGMRSLSEGVGQPGWMQTTRNPFGNGETIAEKLGQLGLKQDDTAGVQLLRGGMVDMVKTLREGMAMGSLSDRDLTFIERLGPTEWQDPDTRLAVLGYIQQAHKAKATYTKDVLKFMTKGMDYSDAVDAAEAKHKDFVPRVPKDLSEHWGDKSQEWIGKRNEWIRRNAPAGTLYHLDDGTILVQRRRSQ